MYLVGVIIYGIAFGFVTRMVIHNKGYDEDWFWWGFWFGVFALIVACTKPQNVKFPSTNSQPSSFYNHNSNYIKESDRIRNQNTLSAGGWVCSCGRVNAAYVSTCVCGKNKNEVNAMVQKQEKEESQQVKNMDESAKITAIKEYKELLDAGIISQEEFDTKKKQLLGL